MVVSYWEGLLGTLLGTSSGNASFANSFRPS